MGLPKREIDRAITYSSLHLTETWRRAIDNKLVVGTVFMDFQKAFDCFSHQNLLLKLEHKRDYLSEREHYTVINGVPSENSKVARHTTGLRTGAHIFRLIHKHLAKAKWGSLFDTCKVKIATLIYKIYNHTTSSCLEHFFCKGKSLSVTSSSTSC